MLYGSGLGVEFRVSGSAFNKLRFQIELDIENLAYRFFLRGLAIMTTKGSHYIINYLDTQAQLNLRAIALGTMSTVIDPEHTGLSRYSNP